ncbi:hypothetical protein SK128_013993 [Halocaridina rubra]|uniref:Uncharacterized protein n=1 Tax=Halocaridina rubra TaxID=373956 RepID=A0AAN8XAK0_HALRR
MAPPTLDPPTTCVALLVLASTILALIFIPKMRIIARQAKEYRHKRLAAATSVSTIFSQHEVTGPLGVASLKEVLKPTFGENPPLLPSQDTLGSSSRFSTASQNSYRAAFSATYGLPQESPVTSPRHAMRNPIYDATPGAYP